MSTEIRRLLDRIAEQLHLRLFSSATAQQEVRHMIERELEALLASQRPPTEDEDRAAFLRSSEGLDVLNTAAAQVTASYGPPSDDHDPGYQEALHRPVGDWKP